jgi:prokaryotic ubiquitin-like protein Pup
MPQQVHTTPARQRSKNVTPEEAEQMVEEASAAQAKAAEGKVTVAEIDELLDEIDSVLEENAAEFVRGYVQKGGQ